MRCEIKLLNKDMKQFTADKLKHPLKNIVFWLKCIMAALPILILNECVTPNTYYVNIGTAIILSGYLFILLNRECKQDT